MSSRALPWKFNEKKLKKPLVAVLNYLAAVSVAS